MNMRKISVTNHMYEADILAIVRMETLDRTCEIVKGCVKGSVPVMEMSYTLNSARDIIQGLSEKYGSVLCADAGTALDAETVRHVILHGVASIITLNYNKEVTKMCNRYQILYTPGCTTTTKCVDALSSEVTFVKVFPISDFYGPKFVKAFKIPVPGMPILVGGEINLDNPTIWLENGVDVYGFGGLLTKESSGGIAANAARIHEIITSFRYSK